MLLVAPDFAARQLQQLRYLKQLGALVSHNYEFRKLLGEAYPGEIPQDLAVKLYIGSPSTMTPRPHATSRDKCFRCRQMGHWQSDWLPDYNRRKGVLVDTSDFMPVEYFKLFFPDEAFELITNETNRYALQLFDDPSPLPQHSRYNNWEETCATELQAYVALQITMGLEDYWETYGLTHTPFCNVMSRNRHRIGWKRKQTNYKSKECDKPMCFLPCHEIYHHHCDYKQAANQLAYHL